MGAHSTDCDVGTQGEGPCCGGTNRALKKELLPANYAWQALRLHTIAADILLGNWGDSPFKKMAFIDNAITLR